MKKTTKAVLFSTLVFPGSGHLTIGRWQRGLLFMIPVIIAMWVYVSNSIKQASIVVDKLMSGEVAPDPVAIAKMLHEGPESGGLMLLAISVYGIIALWVLAAIDAFIVARKITLQEKKDQSGCVQSPF